MEEFDEFAAGFSIQDMMDDTGMTRSGVDTWLRRNGHRPFRKEGGKGFYEPHVLHELMMHRKDKPPRTSPTSKTLKTSQEYEERITYLEAKVKQILEILEDLEVVETP